MSAGKRRRSNSFKRRFWEVLSVRRGKLPVFFLCFLIPFAAAQEIEGKGGVFFFGSMQNYLPSKDFSIPAMPSFTFGGGWEQTLGPGAALLSLETGNPLSLGGSHISSAFPLMVQAAYAFPLSPEFSLMGGLSAGGVGLGGAFIPAFGPRLYGELGTSDGPFSFFLGGGLDFLVKFGNITSVPILKMGLRFRPGKIPGNKTPAPGGNGRAESGVPGPSPQTAPVASQSGADIPVTGTGGAQAGLPGTVPQAAGGSAFSAVQPSPAMGAPVESGASGPSPQTAPAASQSGADIPAAAVATVSESVGTGSLPVDTVAPLRLPQGNHPMEILIDGRRGFALEEFTVYFGPDDSVLQPEEKDKLIQAAELLAPYPGSRIIISGHTALAGTEQGRERISHERAQAVTDFLAACGLEAGRLETLWYSARQPAAPNSSNEGRARNRRVELVVVDTP
ncbi:MAG: OmpA family protein [Treponema sp.]|nr:OmpA family protein [Treponema sp.]